jgi:crossover junction endodeoxyribonuclease RusA
MSSKSFRAFVPGHPAPQGSKRHVGKGIMVESSKHVAPWRSDVRSACLDAAGKPLAFFGGPVNVELLFVLRRPVATPKKLTPPAIKKPDIDKLARAILDAIGSAGMWRDDSQVVALMAFKKLAGFGETPGCRIAIVGATYDGMMWP